MDKLGPQHVQDTHSMLALFQFPFVVVSVFTSHHPRCDIHRAHVQQCLHRLVGALGGPRLGTDGGSGVIPVRREAGEAAELPGIAETREAACDGYHIDGDPVPDAVDALEQIPLPPQDGIRLDEGVDLLIDTSAASGMEYRTALSSYRCAYSAILAASTVSFLPLLSLIEFLTRVGSSSQRNTSIS